MRISALFALLLISLSALQFNALGSIERVDSKVTPYFEHGSFLGFRFTDVTPNSEWAKRGLKNGDVILAVNLDSISSVDEMSAKVKQMRTEKHVRLLLKGDDDHTREIQYDNY